MRGKNQKHRSQRNVIIISNQQFDIHFRVITFHFRNKDRVKILNIIQMETITDCCFLVKIIPDFQSFHPHRTNLYPPFQSQSDIIARLRPHPGKDLLFRGRQINHNGIDRQNICIRFSEVAATGTVIKLDFLEFFLGKSDPASILIKILFLTPVTFPVQVITQGNAVLRQIRTEVL